MHRSTSRAALLGIAVLLAACAGTPRSAGVPPGAVSVSWTDPARFDDARDSRDTPAMREAWVSELGRHLAERAAQQLPADQRLDVRFTDIRRAGAHEPWRGPQADRVRIVRDVYPPRIALEFKRLGADGRVVHSGQRELRDLGFLMRPNLYASDPLGHEKLLLDDWVRKEFAAGR